MDEYITKVGELAAVKAQITALNTKKAELEAYFLQHGAEDIKDTKNKSISYQGEGASVTYTEAQKLSLEAPAFLKQLFGIAFGDVIETNTETSYKVKSSAIERMLIGLYTGNYTKITPSEVIAQLPCSPEKRQAVAKKLKGANFETDKKNLISICGFADDDASDYAYMYAESVVYDDFLRVLQLSGHSLTDTDISEMVKGIGIAVSVEDTTKIAIK